MKKLILFAIILMFSIKIFAQEIEMISARQAYDYLKKENTFEKYELAFVMGIQAGMGAEVDFLTGTANFWVFLCKSKDTSDHLGHMFVPIKMGEAWEIMYQTDGQADFQTLASIPNENWVNSTTIGDNIKNNKQFINFLQVNASNIQMKQLSMMYADHPIPGAGEPLMQWMAVAFVTQDNTALCYYDATNGNPLFCSIPPITSIVSEKFKNFHFPNPSFGKLTLKSDITQKSTVLIYDATGNIAMKLDEVVPSNLNIDLSKLSNGQYTVVILSNDKMTSQKVLLFK